MDEGGGRLTTDEQKPYRMEYCEGCPVPDCDFYDAECSRQWVDKLLAQERERCVVECDRIEARWRGHAQQHDLPVDHGRRDGAMWCADAIRKLGVSD